MSNFPSNIVQAGKSFHIGLVFPEYCAMQSHLRIWKEIKKPEVDSYCIITTNHSGDSRKSILMFSTETNLVEFQNWWEAYSIRFSDCDIMNKIVPIIKEGAFISGYPIKEGDRGSSTAGRYDRDEIRANEWRWIVANTHGVVILVNNYWLFEDITEMTMFKLMGDTTTLAWGQSSDDGFPPF